LVRCAQKTATNQRWAQSREFKGIVSDFSLGEMVRIRPFKATKLAQYSFFPIHHPITSNGGSDACVCSCCSRSSLAAKIKEVHLFLILHPQVLMTVSSVFLHPCLPSFPPLTPALASAGLVIRMCCSSNCIAINKLQNKNELQGFCYQPKATSYTNLRISRIMWYN